jgi:hypothetical protein
MDAKSVEFTLVMTELILRHGVPAAISAITALRTEDPTLEQIKALKRHVKTPASYFENNRANQRATPPQNTF